LKPDLVKGRQFLPPTGFLIPIRTFQMGRNIDPDEALRYFSWNVFAIVALVFTGFVFWQELAKNGPFIFSHKNTRSKLQVLLAHAIFLMILLYGYRIVINVIPRLPFWMTDTFQIRYSTRASFADMLLFLAVLGMAYFERKWLYRQRQAPLGNSDSSSLEVPPNDH
jgi:hypothetical protein